MSIKVRQEPKRKIARRQSKKTDLWEEVTYQGKRDLREGNNQEVFEAVLYFFTKGDDTDLRTFVGLQRAHNIDPDRAAKEIWNQLTPKRQELIRNILQKASYQIPPAN